MIIGILQARLSSTRLPKKVIKPILGIPMIVHQVRRLMKSKMIDKLVVATSDSQSDDELVHVLKEFNIKFFRGSLDNVLDRYYQISNIYKPETIVRLTADCPLADPYLIDRIINFHIKGNFDCTSNVKPPTFPDGLDVEVFSAYALDTAWNNAIFPSEFEHVTPYFYKNTNLFYVGNYENYIDFSQYRWTVDEPEDYNFVLRVYENLYSDNNNFTTKDILKLLEKNPDICNINSDFARNEGAISSYKKDKEM